MVEESNRKSFIEAVPIPNFNSFFFDLEMNSPISVCFDAKGKLEHYKTIVPYLSFIANQPGSYHNSKFILRNLKEAFDGKNPQIEEYLTFIDGGDDDIEERHPQIFQLGAYVSMRDLKLMQKCDSKNIMREFKSDHEVKMKKF